MQRYGAHRFNVPTFVPNLSCAKYEAKDLFQVVDRNGAVVAPPYTLRIPFARYVARNKVHVLRRYAIERVYRRSKSHYHPEEYWECAFDIVTPKISSVKFPTNMSKETECVCDDSASATRNFRRERF